MTIRTSKRTVTFRRPFILDGYDGVLPAGAYEVETDEELLEGVSFPVYRRTLTVLHLHPAPGLTQTLMIDPNDLDTALARDQMPAPPPTDAGTDQKTRIAVPQMRGYAADYTPSNAPKTNG